MLFINIYKYAKNLLQTYTLYIKPMYGKYLVYK